MDLLNLGSSIRQNSLWVLSGSLGGQVVQFLFGIVLARLLVPEDFGLLVTIQVFTGVIGLFAAAGMGDALVQAKTATKRDFHVIFTMQLAVCVLIYVALYAAAPFFAIWFDEPRYVNLLRVSAITFLLRPFIAIPSTVLRRQMRFKPMAWIKVAGITASGIASTLLALKDMGPWSLVLGGLAGSVMQIVLTFLVTRWLPALRFGISTARTLGAYGLRVSANEIVVYIRYQSANLLISHQLGPTYVGLFNKSDSLARMPTDLLSGSAYQTLFRALSSLQNNLDKSRYLFLRSLLLVAFYTTPLYITLAWVAKPLILTLYGEHWASASIPLQVLCLVRIIRPIANLSGAVVAAQDRLGKEIWIQAQTVGVLVVGILMGLQGGLVGVAIGTAPSLIYNAWRMYKLAEAILCMSPGQLWLTLKPIARPTAALILALLLTHIAMSHFDTTRPLYLLATLSAGFLAYVSAFLYNPGSALQTEADRWKMALRFALRQ